MKEKILGHTYELDNLKSDGITELRFYRDPKLHDGRSQRGPSTQEVIRACIARVKALDEEAPAPENREILNSLRRAIIFFEVRALRRSLEKAVFGVETLSTGDDGHVFFLQDDG